MLFLALMQPPMAPVITSGMYEGYEEWGGEELVWREGKK